MRDPVTEFTPLIKVRAPLVTINEYFYEMLFMISMIIMTFIVSTVECTTLPEKLKLYLSEFSQFVR